MQANIKACNPKNNGIYNVGTGSPRSFKDIVDILQKELGKKLRIEYFPNPYDGYKLNTQADITSTTENLCYEPYFSLEKGIQSYLPEIKRLYGLDSQ